MFSHTIGSNDLASARNFFGRLLAPLGITLPSSTILNELYSLKARLTQVRRYASIAI